MRVAALVAAGLACGRGARARDILRQSDAAAPSLDVLEALVLLESDPRAARDLYARHLEREPSLVAAAHWIQGGQASSSDAGASQPADAALRPLLARGVRMVAQRVQQEPADLHRVAG